MKRNTIILMLFFACLAFNVHAERILNVGMMDNSCDQRGVITAVTVDDSLHGVGNTVGVTFKNDSGKCTIFFERENYAEGLSFISLTGKTIGIASRSRLRSSAPYLGLNANTACEVKSYTIRETVE